MRLIDADALIEAMKKTEDEHEKAMTCPSWWSAFNVISEQPIAYDIDKVVEELEEVAYVHDDVNSFIDLEDAIEIVKHGGVGKDVEQKKSTGIVKRFDDLGRIVIPKEIRRQLFGTKYTDGEPMEIFMDKDDIVLRKYEEENSDDVCEWRLCDEEANVYDTSCRNPHILIEGTPKENNYEYCPYCGKKIKVVE